MPGVRPRDPQSRGVAQIGAPCPLLPWVGFPGRRTLGGNLSKGRRPECVSLPRAEVSVRGTGGDGAGGFISPGGGPPIDGAGAMHCAPAVRQCGTGGGRRAPGDWRMGCERCADVGAKHPRAPAGVTGIREDAAAKMHRSKRENQRARAQIRREKQAKGRGARRGGGRDTEPGREGQGWRRERSNLQKSWDSRDSGCYREE